MFAEKVQQILPHDVSVTQTITNSTNFITSQPVLSLSSDNQRL